MNLRMIPKAFLSWLPAIVLCAFCLACGGEKTASIPEDSALLEENVVMEDLDIRTAPAMSVEDALRLPEGGQGRRMILEKGNVRTTGVPGFGENALSALSGTYSITGGDMLFTVWLCREPLYYSGWDARDRFEDFPAQERYDGSDLLVAAPFNETWTGIFSFPGDSDLSQNDIDRIIGIYRSRFLYFLTMTNSVSDISLPAYADF